MAADQVVAFLLFALVAAVTPGPSNVMLTAAGARAGVRRGLPCLLGVAAGMGTMMFAVPLGLGSLVLTRPRLLAVLQAAGAAVLLWLAWRIATSGGPADAAGAGAPVGFLGAALFQWTNPKSWLVAAGAAGAYLRPEGAGPVGQAAALAGLFVLAALPSGLAWLAFGAALQRLLRGPRAWRLFNVAMGALLALSIGLIVG
jgi:threonine/homoserine/homoserine lactone efflux protein